MGIPGAFISRLYTPLVGRSERSATYLVREYDEQPSERPVMSVTTALPGFILSGGSAGNSAGLNSPGQLELIYSNLTSEASDIVSGVGVKILNMDAGSIGTAGSAQIGATETADEVANNLKVLGSIAAFCKANGVVVQVDASLTYGVTYADGSDALVDQWAQPAAAVGLPIVSVQDVQEIGISQPKTNFNNIGTVEANAVRTLIDDYAGSSYIMTAQNLAVGDMEGGGASSMIAISEWWAAANAALAGAGLQRLSYVTADTGWYAPWIDPLSTPTNDAYLEALSSLAVSQGMALNVLVEGSLTNTSSDQFVRQSEQNAVHLAALQAAGSVDVSNVVFRSWGVQPVGVAQITSPTSMVNDDAEISSIYSLYECGLITAKGSAVLGTPSQFLLYTDVPTGITGVGVNWDIADIQAGNRLAVVLIDQNGAVTASQYGSGYGDKPGRQYFGLDR